MHVHPLYRWRACFDMFWCILLLSVALVSFTSFCFQMLPESARICQMYGRPRLCASLLSWGCEPFQCLWNNRKAARCFSYLCGRHSKPRTASLGCGLIWDASSISWRNHPFSSETLSTWIGALPKAKINSIKHHQTISNISFQRCLPIWFPLRLERDLNAKQKSAMREKVQKNREKYEQKLGRPLNLVKKWLDMTWRKSRFEMFWVCCGSRDVESAFCLYQDKDE